MIELDGDDTIWQHISGLNLSDRKPTDDEVKEMLDAVGDLDSFEITPHQNDLVVLMMDSAMLIAPSPAASAPDHARVGPEALGRSDRGVGIGLASAVLLVAL